MMKKYTIRTVVTLMISWIMPHIHRIFNNRPVEYIHPFIYGSDREGQPLRISWQWYIKDIGDMVSFSLLMLTVCMILIPVIKHIKEAQWIGHNKLLIFVSIWYKLFIVILVTSVLDLIHYLIAFKQLEYYFLILNGVYFLMSFYLITKLCKR